MSYTNLEIEDDIPSDIKLALKTFIEGAKMMEEYKLDFMPSEYMANLVETLSHHPEYSDIVLELVDILIPNLYEEEKEEDIIKT